MLGSNIFDLCVAIPAGVLIAGSAIVDFAAAVPMMGVLTFATVLLFAFLRTDLELGPWEGVALLATYAAFIAFALETGGLIDLVYHRGHRGEGSRISSEDTERGGPGTQIRDRAATRSGA